MFWLVGLVNLILLAQHTLCAKPGISIKPLHQGLLIQQQGGLFYQSADWVVIVTISTPPLTNKFQELAADLRTEIDRIQNRFPQLAENWISRLVWCQNSLDLFSHKRQKRAPIGFVGKLSHTLFGTVTEDELAQYRAIIMDNRNSLNKTVHRSNLLLSATKSNRHGINRNSEQIYKLRKYLTSLQRSLSTNFRITSDSLDLLNIKIKIEHVLNTLEHSTHRILTYYRHRRRQFNSLYRHTLSEDLLEPAELEKILKQARGLRFATLTPTWYYENCYIVPLWSNTQDVTFKIHLPLHDGKNYFLYSLHSYPFPVKPGFNSQLDVRSHVAYSSSSGLLFSPNLCLGTNTKVFRGGPLYEDSEFACERALISRNAAETKSCKVKIFSANSTRITEFRPGFYILSTPSVTTKLHCDALSEAVIPFKAGVFMVSLNHTCTLRGKEWTLPGLNKYLTPLHIKNQIAPISLRTVFAPYAPHHLQKIAEIPHWIPISKLPSLTLEPLSEPAPLLSLPTIGAATWANSSAIIIIVTFILILVISVKLCNIHRRIPRFFLPKHPSAPEEHELQTRADPPPEINNPALRLPRYPDLGRETSS